MSRHLRGTFGTDLNETLVLPFCGHLMHHFQRPIFLDKIIVNYDALLQIVLSTANTWVVYFQSSSSIEKATSYLALCGMVYRLPLHSSCKHIPAERKIDVSTQRDRIHRICRQLVVLCSCLCHLVQTHIDQSHLAYNNMCLDSEWWLVVNVKAKCIRLIFVFIVL